jgi:transcriptional regulator with XRE-family HTH domain
MCTLWPVQDQNHEGVEAVFASRLRETREAAGLSQARLAALVAKRSGIELDPTAITRIERGQRKIGLEEAQAIASALDVTLEYLCRPGPVPASTLLERRLVQAEAMLEHYQAMTVTAERGRNEAESYVAEARAELSAAREAEERTTVRQIADVPGEVIVSLHDYDAKIGKTVIHVYGDIREVAKTLSAGRPVVFDLRGTADQDPGRAIRSAGLAAEDLQRSISWIGDKVFRLDPSPLRPEPDPPMSYLRRVPDLSEYTKPSPGKLAYYRALCDISQELFGRRNPENTTEFEQVIAEAEKRGIRPPDERPAHSGKGDA